MIDATDSWVLIVAGIVLGVSSFVILIQSVSDDAPNQGNHSGRLQRLKVVGWTVGAASIAVLVYVLLR